MTHFPAAGDIYRFAKSKFYAIVGIILVSAAGAPMPDSSRKLKVFLCHASEAAIVYFSSVSVSKEGYVQKEIKYAQEIQNKGSRYMTKHKKPRLPKINTQIPISRVRAIKFTNPREILQRAREYPILGCRIGTFEE